MKAAPTLPGEVHQRARTRNATGRRPRGEGFGTVALVCPYLEPFQRAVSEGFPRKTRVRKGPDAAEPPGRRSSPHTGTRARRLPFPSPPRRDVAAAPAAGALRAQPRPWRRADV